MTTETIKYRLTWSGGYIESSASTAQADLTSMLPACPGGVVAVAPIDTVTVSPTIARQSGELYVQQFFTVMQLMELMLLLNSPATPPTQLSMVQADYGWIISIRNAWNSSPATFVPPTFGAPPYTYSAIINTTT